MTRPEIFIRLGWYCGFIAMELRDFSFAERVLGRAHEVSDEQAIAMMREIQAKLVLNDVIGPDEDPFTESGIQMRDGE